MEYWFKMSKTRQSKHSFYLLLTRFILSNLNIAPNGSKHQLNLFLGISLPFINIIISQYIDRIHLLVYICWYCDTWWKTKYSLIQCISLSTFETLFYLMTNKSTHSYRDTCKLILTIVWVLLSTKSKIIDLSVHFVQHVDLQTTMQYWVTKHSPKPCSMIKYNVK